MTDIDAIRKRDARDHGSHDVFYDCLPAFECRADRRGLLEAFDAKCEELARRIGQPVPLSEWEKLVAERDAAVRALRLTRPLLDSFDQLLRRLARNRSDSFGELSSHVANGFEVARAIEAIDAQLAALAPPTEQPTTITTQGER